MLYNILAIGDVTSEDGLKHLRRHLPPLKKLKSIDFTVVNGENISGVGLTPEQAEDLFAVGADVITLGNHTWGKMQIADYLEDSPYILRPANFSPRTPGRGVGVYDCGRFRIRVISLIGRCDLSWGSDNPFTTADRLLAEPVADLAGEVIDHTEKANSIFPKGAPNMELRKGHLLEARAALMALDVRLGHCYTILALNPQGCFTKPDGKSIPPAEATKKLDDMAQSLGEKIDRENELIRAVLESDRKRK